MQSYSAGKKSSASPEKITLADITYTQKIAPDGSPYCAIVPSDMKHGEHITVTQYDATAAALTKLLATDRELLALAYAHRYGLGPYPRRPRTSYPDPLAELGAKNVAQLDDRLMAAGLTRNPEVLAINYDALKCGGIARENHVFLDPNGRRVLKSHIMDGQIPTIMKMQMQKPQCT